MRRMVVVAAMVSGFVLATPAATADTTVELGEAMVVTRPTPTEECSDPSVVDEFGHGSYDYCLEAMADEINPGPPRKLDIWEDGSGRLAYVVVNPDGSSDWHERTYPADTFTWNCATMGNRICGPAPLPELPRTF